MAWSGFEWFKPVNPEFFAYCKELLKWQKRERKRKRQKRQSLRKKQPRRRKKRERRNKHWLHQNREAVSAGALTAFFSLL